jgi:HD-like signal output (HDOD) protein
MITKDEINLYIDKIPPVSKILSETLNALNEGELVKAANIAKEDMALSAYLRDLVNRPIFGFTNEVHEVSQIFGILGVSGSQQSVYNYMINLLSPDKWIVFNLNGTTFSNLQAELSANWKKILAYLQIKDKTIESSIALLPASVIVSEAMFCNKLDDVTLLKTNASLDFNTILQRLCGLDLFDICEMIVKKWNLPKDVAEIIHASSGIRPSDNTTINTLAKWMHLLLFYTLSKPLFIEAQLNDFIDFQIDYINDIYEDFSTLMEIA